MISNHIDISYDITRFWGVTQFHEYLAQTVIHEPVNQPVSQIVTQTADIPIDLQEDIVCLGHDIGDGLGSGFMD